MVSKDTSLIHRDYKFFTTALRTRGFKFDRRANHHKQADLKVSQNFPIPIQFPENRFHEPLWNPTVLKQQSGFRFYLRNILLKWSPEYLTKIHQKAITILLPPDTSMAEHSSIQR